MRSPVQVGLEASNRHRNALWILFLLIGLAGLVVSAPLPVERRGSLYPLLGLGAGLAAFLGTRLYQLPISRPWLFLATGVTLVALGDLLTSLLLPAGGGQVLFPSIADVASFAGLIAFTIGLALFAGSRHAGLGYGAILDAPLIACAIGLLAWVAGLHQLIGVTDSSLAAAVALAYSFMDLVLLGLTVHLLLGRGGPTGSQLLLAGGVTGWLIGDTVFTLHVLASTVDVEGLTDIALATGYVLIATAALHPAMLQTSRHQAPRLETLPSTARVVAFIALALLPAALLWLPGVAEDRVTLLGVQVAGVGLTALVELRVGLLLVQVNRSIQERRRLEGELRNAADRDPLVGLFNRRIFRERLEAALGGADRGAAALFIDLDDFKLVNDSLGHAAGDQALVEAARRIERALRPNDVAARLGGDEFAALLPACESAEVARAVATRLLKMFEEPFYAGGQTVKIGASIGIAFAYDARDADALMRQADLAMYLAKAGGKRRIELVENGADRSTPDAV